MPSPHSSRICGPNPVLEDSELVLALVGPLGTHYDRFTNFLRRSLEEYGYTTNLVRLSKLTENFEVEPKLIDGTEEYQRSSQLMHAGNFLRFASRKGEFLALAAAQAIRASRYDDGAPTRTVHVLRSLKHPDEVRALRRIYGTGFFMIAITADERERRRHLTDDLGCTKDEVDELLRRDEHEEDADYIDEKDQNFGQRTRDTFQLADVFVPLDDEHQLQRFLGLVFGHPFTTPTADEHAMFLAFGASLRSGDLSRQVGAVICSSQGDLLGVGANDVPRRGGGLYWPGNDDDRDHVRGCDSNQERRDEIVTDVLRRLRPDHIDEGSWLGRGKIALRGSPVMDITEYGRAVHAEMEALLSCLRTGVSVRDGTLYSTTFPCHNCAKHIVAAGMKRVVFVEPYPKSQAIGLFHDSIVLGNEDPKRVEDPRVVFQPFVGVAARRFFDLFSMSLSWGTPNKRKSSGRMTEWTPKKAILRIPLLPNSYLDRERLAEQELVALSDPPKEGGT